MNYNIYHNGREDRVTFNYINTVGDLQTAIIQTINTRRDTLLYIMHDTRILGLDVSFDANLLEEHLYETNLYLVFDTHSASLGSKLVYQQWLNSKLEQQDLIRNHQQLLYHYTRSTQLAPNISFFTNNRPIYANNNQSVPYGTRSPVTEQYNWNQPGGLGQQQQTSNTMLFAGHGGNPVFGNSNRPRGNNSGNRNNGVGGFGFTRTRNGGNQVSFTNTNSNAAGNETGTGTGAGTGLMQQFMAAFQGETGTGIGGSTSNSNNFPDLIQQLMNHNNISDFDISFTSVPLNNIPTGPAFFEFILNNMNFDSVPITLDRQALNRLPTFRFSELPARINNSQACSICVENYVPTDEVRVLLCRHYFHKQCIDRWLSQENVRCPLCRHDNREAHPHEDSQNSSENDNDVDGEETNSNTTNGDAEAGNDAEEEETIGEETIEETIGEETVEETIGEETVEETIGEETVEEKETKRTELLEKWKK